jgi:hypothetical protein
MPILGSFGAGSARGFGATAGGASTLEVDYLVIGGGGGGATDDGGGGGGGGMRTSFPGGTTIAIESGSTITVGDGGIGAPPASVDAGTD